MRKIIYILIVAAIILTSCSKDKDGFHHYVVKAGNENCSVLNGRLPIFSGDKNSIDAWYKVNESWVWTDSNTFFSHSGTAKIFGLGNGMNHRDESFRVGYRHNYGIGVVGLFVEQGSQYFFYPIDTVNPGDVLHARLAIEGDYYVLRQGDREVRHKARFDKWASFRLYPCMAGGYRLMHDWVVPIKWDK